MSMSQGPKSSLLDETDSAAFDASRKKGKPAQSSGARASNADRAKQVKIGVAAALLVVAVVLLAWNFGLFSGTPSDQQVAQPAPASAEEAAKLGVPPAANRRLAPGMPQ